MSFNCISAIKKTTFIRMFWMIELYLQSNIIEMIENDSFVKLNKLVFLNLANNRLTNLGNDTFCGLFNLKYLNLNRNSVKFIQKGLFRQLSNLNELYLDYNPIKFIEEYSFQKLAFLKKLHINWFDSSSNEYTSNNSSTSITNSTFAGLINLRRLDLKKEVLKSSFNLIHIISNLFPIYDKTITGRHFYKSRNLIYINEQYTKWDCFVVLYSIRNKIQVNLYEDTSVDAFINYCGQFDLIQLRFTDIFHIDASVQ
jgi:hypothetical protein